MQGSLKEIELGKQGAWIRMAEKKTIEVRFVEKGDKIVMKQNYPNFEMDSREVMVQIDQLRNGIQKTKDQIANSETQVKNFKESIVINEERLKALEKFEPEMMAIQESKAKAILQEIKVECKELVEKEYKTDDALTEDMNNKQRWRIYQQKVATHEKAATQLAPKVITRFYYKESILDNPWE